MVASALFARVEHGSHRVVPEGSGFKVAWPQGDETYPSARQTIIALVNGTPKPTPKSYDPHLTFNRYFRQGNFKRSKAFQGPDVFEMFKPSPGLAVSPTKTLVNPSPSLTVFVPKGIDLHGRGHEVRKLFFAGFARKVLRMGYEPEDVLQEVFHGLLVRNKGKCPFDPAKSSFGHYVHMVAGCIISNYRRRYARLERNEVFGVFTLDGDMVDVAEADIVHVDAVQEDAFALQHTVGVLGEKVYEEAYLTGYDPEAAVKMIDLLYEGRRNKEIVEITGIPAARVSKMVRMVKTVARRELGER